MFLSTMQLRLSLSPFKTWNQSAMKYLVTALSCKCGRSLSLCSSGASPYARGWRWADCQRVKHGRSTAQGSCIPYCCTKAAIDNLTVSLARTLAPHIRSTPLLRDSLLAVGPNAASDRNLIQFNRHTAINFPLGEVCYPHDVADAILSLLHGSQRMTGHNIDIDSGMTIAGFQVTFD